VITGRVSRESTGWQFSFSLDLIESPNRSRIISSNHHGLGLLVNRYNVQGGETFPTLGINASDAAPPSPSRTPSAQKMLCDHQSETISPTTRTAHPPSQLTCHHEDVLPPRLSPLLETAYFCTFATAICTSMSNFTSDR
jgi:hypothetical protein